MAQQQIGDYTRQTRCRFCQNENLTKILDFGNVPLAGGFLRSDQRSDEKFYPLALQFCRDCTLVQVQDSIPPATLFRNYFYFSSSIQTLVGHFAEFAEEVVSRFEDPSAALVVEIGSNDGVFLKPLTNRGVTAVGVEPATNVVASIDTPGLNVVNEFFNEEVALRVREQYGLADTIVSSYTLAHIDDMTGVLNGVKALLKKEGQFVFEVYYLGALMDELQYDMIYHEHVNYYSMAALTSFFKRFGLEIFDVKALSLRGGTMRYYVGDTELVASKVTPAVQALIDQEHEKGLDSLDSYRAFADRVENSRTELMKVLGELKRDGKMVAGYGASGRATTIMSYCAIGEEHLNYVVDDAPAKHGLYTPGSHLPIVAWEATQDEWPDYLLLFAWSFAKEVIDKRADYLAAGGKFIIPLPTVKIVGG
jgi:predicted TPR repeat methyltransferase